jgi:SAM-dependent methyltransferase
MALMSQEARAAAPARESVKLGHIHPAADIAGAAILLNVGERIGALPYLSEGKAVTAGYLAHTLKLPQSALSDYLKALASAGLMETVNGSADEFEPSAGFSEMLYAVGYVSWTLNANRPYMDHAVEFFRSTPQARTQFHRDGHQIAITSQWMGAEDFYPAARAAIFALKPKRFVDLGAGSARLLIEVLLKFPQSTGVALDISAKSCAAARAAAERAQVLDRLEIVERSIESVASDPVILQDADAIHGGFVFHDMLPHDESTFEQVLRNSARALAKTRGRMLVTDAAPYVQNPHERVFSAAFSFLHHFFMGRRLLSEEEWAEKFRGSGFQAVECTRLPFPTARLYVAAAA